MRRFLFIYFPLLTSEFGGVTHIESLRQPTISPPFSFCMDSVVQTIDAKYGSSWSALRFRPLELSAVIFNEHE